jgi:hypothetical protein
MNKIKTYFNLDRPYEFDVTDLTALIYTICAIGVICGVDMTILFFIGSTIATAFCLGARRINLVVLNVSLWFMNLYYLIIMIWG